ncbi:carboxypeptidase-like regulatory domain-containing protein [Actinoplanes sp. NPDC051411]|uniref:carboxypeptidase-like regulatory domain-containing protein n=1 Tax=Actinoplanes sp. NPDC051411 TaxID=3155522 RepID=UPI00342A1A7F
MIRSPLGRLGMAGVAGLLAVGALAAPAAAAAKGTIQGTFTTSSGAPVQSASVYIVATDFSSQTSVVTDATGAFRAQMLPGDYHVSFAWDSAVQWAHQAADEDTADTITVASGQTVEVDDQQLPTGTVGGRLTSADGSPLVSASVTLHHGVDEKGWATTDDNGDYSFGAAIARDGYTVSFSTTDDIKQWVAGKADQGSARTFAVTAGAQTTVDDTQLALGSVHGRLVDPDGKPQSGYEVDVTLDDENDYVNQTATTDDNGEWSVSPVFPGDYRVSFVSPGFQRTQWAYGASTAADAKLITVAPGGQAEVNDTWLTAAQLVINAVDSTTGAPVSNYCVWLETGNDAGGCTTGSQITVGNLPGGTFPLQVTPDSSTYYLFSPRNTVTLIARQTTTVTIPLVQGGKVAFSSADHATGAPVKGTCAVLKVIGQGGLGDGYGDCTNAVGKGVTDNSIAPGTYELFAVAPGKYGHQWVGKQGGTGDQQAAARIVVKPGKTVTAPAALLDPAGTVTGVVTGSDGQPVTYGDVAFSAWGDAGPDWDTSVGQNGGYTLGKLGPYAWPLLFSAGTDPRQWSGNVANRFQATGVPVTANGTTTYDISLIKGATLKGTVTIPSAPTANWRLNMFNAATGDQMGSFDSSAAGPGGSYSAPLIGGSTKIAWHYYSAEFGPDGDGWYNGATSIDTATKVAIPAQGGKTLNLQLG